MTCCCAMAGTAACKTCSNNYDANINDSYKTFITSNTYLAPAFCEEKIKPTIQYWCGECESILSKFQKFCHNCGKKIDWSEIEKDN